LFNQSFVIPKFSRSATVEKIQQYKCCQTQQIS